VRDEADFAELLARARNGDEAAVRELLDRFEPEIRGVVRGRLPKTLRTQFDSMDFVQAVWQSFFFRLRGRSPEFSNPGHLRGYLAGIARNKVFEEHRKRTRTEKYAITREQRLYTQRGEHEVARDLVSPDPSPSQAVQASDRLAQLLAGCRPHEVRVITLRHQGLTFDEIAARTGINERSARKIIDDARERMEARGWR
jgi:RNA polymerase sigma-70 factor (ECF subfamily)